MSKRTTARARIESEVKEEREKILNQETRRVLRQSEQGVEVARFDSAEPLFEDLGI